MNENDLRTILRRGFEDIIFFINEYDSNLSNTKRESLIEALSSIDFSPKKHDILSSNEDILVKSVLVGLLYGQIDPNIYQDKENMKKYSLLFFDVCDNFKIPRDLIYPINRYSSEICKYL